MIGKGTLRAWECDTITCFYSRVMMAHKDMQYGLVKELVDDMSRQQNIDFIMWIYTTDIRGLDRMFFKR